MPSKEYIEALEETEVIGLSYEHLELLCEEFPTFGRVVRKLLWKYYAMFYDERTDLLHATKEERYQYLLEKHPVFFQRVPLNYLSSYLGMSPASFSRARGKI